MQYVKQEITTFTSTNLTDIYADWNPATTYILETDNENLTNASVVRYGAYYYRSVTNGNLNFNPSQYENIKWVKLGISNKFGLIDLSSQSKSIVEGGNLTVTFPQNKIRTLGLGNYEADTIMIEVLGSDGTTVLWTYSTDSSINDNVTDYYTYIYEDYNYTVDRAIKLDIGVDGSFIRVTLNKSIEATRTACGFLVGGVAINMGNTLMGIKFNFNSFAEKNLDELGTLTITKRAVQDLIDFETTVEAGRLSDIRREIKKVYNDIVMFILDENDVGNYENLLTLGVIQDSSVLLENHVEAIVSFSIMEAI